MKKLLQYILLITVISCFSVGTIQAQAPPHPNQTSSSGALGGGRIGANTDIAAPVGNGTLILLVLAIAYAGRRTYTLRQQEEE